MRASKNFALQVSTLIVITACFVVIGSSLLLSQNMKKILTLWGDDIQMTVYLSPELNPTQQAALEKNLSQIPEIGEVKYITQQKALSDFRSQLATYAPDIAQDDELMKVIPSSLQVSLSSKVSASERNSVLQNLAARIHDMAGVDEVSYGQDWVEKYASLVSGVDVVIQLLTAVLIIAALFVMSNVIRASVQSRYDEIAVMELVGATSRMIRRPFLMEGAVLGGLSSVLALMVCYVFYKSLRHLLITHLSFLQIGQNLSFLTVISLILFALGGSVLGAVGSYLCVRKINHGWAASRG